MTAQAGDTLLTKAALRRELRRRRAAIAPPERRRAAEQAARRLARLPAFRAARRVAIYLEHQSELPTAPLIALCRAQDKAVFVPRVGAARGMRFVELRPGAGLRRDRHGIRMPAAHAARVTLARLDLIVVPLVGFDLLGHRLGTGGGYYDRALAGARVGRRPLRLGYAYAVQRVERLPHDPWDAPLDGVVTERETFLFHRLAR